MNESREEEFTDRMFLFLSAQKEAEKKGQEEFTCPLCGGEAWWGRAPLNGHLHCGCLKCKISIME